MVILTKKFLTKFTKIWNFIPNTVFGNRLNINKKLKGGIISLIIIY